jgi:hypothetical protein
MTKKLDQRSAIEKYNDPDNLFLTTKEVAKLLGVAYSTVMNAYRETGEIMIGVPVHKIGTKTLKVKASDLKKIVGA